jgi:EAL domain-containing protein (putative c-di-GMP-specific phosphodiesterase class I)
VPYAEATGVIAEIDMTMLTTVLHDLQMVSEHTPLDMAISFNLSVATLTYPGFLNFLYDLLSRYDMSGIKLCAEVTETMALSSHFDSQRVIHAMSDLGIRISIDDFGTGFSSLSLLREFPVNELKIDRSFTAGIAWDSPDLAIIKSIALLGHELDMHIVAEGVETEFQATALKDLGVHAGQGHYFGKPQLRPVFQNDSV